MIYIIVLTIVTTLTAMAFILGKKYTEKDIENEAAKEALKAAKKIAVKRDRIKEKYERLRSKTPGDWPPDSLL